MNRETTIWGIHGGRMGDADGAFLKKNVVALGWVKIGDLSKIDASREAFKEKYLQTYSDKPGAVPVNAGQLFRFVHEMKIGDIIAYPSKRDRHIHIGEITGDYRYAPEVSADYPNTRSVKWLKAVPRTRFSQGALYEIGSAMSLFQIKNYADEYHDILENRAVKEAVPASDTEVEVIAERIEENTHDFVASRLSRELKGHPFADFVGHLLNTMGYRTRVAPPGTDGGVDIIAHRDELGFEPPIIKVQVKSIDGKTGNAEVSALYGNVSPGEYGLLVTLGSFTNPAISFAKSKSNLRLIDGTKLIELVLDHYEQLDAKYKGLIPLKRVYVPEGIDEGEV